VTKPKPLFAKNFLRTPKEDMIDSGSEGWLCLSQDGYGRCSPNNIARDAKTLVTMHLMQGATLAKINKIGGARRRASRSLRPGTRSPKLCKACISLWFGNAFPVSDNPGLLEYDVSELCKA